MKNVQEKKKIDYIESEDLSLCTCRVHVLGISLTIRIGSAVQIYGLNHKISFRWFNTHMK